MYINATCDTQNVPSLGSQADLSRIVIHRWSYQLVKGFGATCSKIHCSATFTIPTFGPRLQTTLIRMVKYGQIIIPVCRGPRTNRLLNAIGEGADDFLERCFSLQFPWATDGPWWPLTVHKFEKCSSCCQIPMVSNTWGPSH